MNVFCNVCGKSMGVRNPRAVYAHLGCADKGCQGIRDRIKAEKAALRQTVECPVYLEPKHRCRIKKD